MFTLIGSVVVLLCVCGSFVMEGGSLLLLWHPGEIIIIVGSAFGAFVTSNPIKVVKGSFAAAFGLVKGPRYEREDYVDLLKLLYDILVKIRKSGMLAIEADVEAPHKSPDTTAYISMAGYTNWDLSADRANAARRALEGGGLALDKVSRVVSLSSSVLFDKENTRNPINRRISVIVMTKEADESALKTDAMPESAAAAAAAATATASRASALPIDTPAPLSAPVNPN